MTAHELLQPLRVSLVQGATRWHDFAANRQHYGALVRPLAGSDLIVLPELWPCGFSSDTLADDARAAAEPLDAPAHASYRLLAQILASYLAGSERDPSARAEEAGRVWGAHLVRKPPPFTSISKEETIDEVVRLHEQFGFRPELRRAKSGQELVLKRCPFQEVATSYQAVICPLHLGLIRGALAELGTGVEADWLAPFAEPGACVGHLTGA